MPVKQSGENNRWLGRSRHFFKFVVVGAIAAGSVCGARLWAQSSVNAPQSAEEAAKTFVLLMSANSALRELQADELIDDTRLQTLEPEMQRRLATRLFRFAQFNTLGTKTLLSADQRRANVTVETVARPKALPPVACVQSVTGWKVDLLETARNWLGSDDALIKEIDAALLAPNPRAMALPANDERAQELCQSRLRQTALGLQQYMQDYDEKLPPADKWNDVFQPYIKNEEIFHCPVLGPTGYGYAMNWKLSKRNLSEVQSPAQTVVFYETNVPRRNAAYDGRDLLFRHQLPVGARANFAYLDGRVETHSLEEPQNFRLIPAALQR